MNGATVRTLLVPVVLMLALGASAAAEERKTTSIQPVTTATPFVPAEGKAEPGRYLIQARVLVAGRPLTTPVKVRFHETVQFFGTREALVGEVMTDGTGLATVVYDAAVRGPHRMTAAFAGDGERAPSRAGFTVETPQVVARHHEGQPLALVRAVAPWAVGSVALAVWAVISFVLIRAVQQIRRGVVRVGADDLAGKEGQP